MGVQSKHFVNAPVSLVIQSLQGLCTINPNVSLDVADKVVHLIDHDKSKVAIICGGGSGHEPAHAGFVGYGMLTAAVCGNIFASPGPNQVKRGIELAGNDAGTLIIVKNYTGDVLNFGLAKEQHAAAHPEKADRVKFLVVGDDVAVGKSQGSIVGRRGLAGTVIVYKIAGAFAQTGASLEEVYKVSEWVSNRLATVGVGLDHCHVPGTATGESHLQGSEVEIGMGIHNEPGTKRVSPVPPLNELIEQLLDLLLSQSDTERSFLPVTGDNDEVVLMVNNLGGVSELELAGVVREVEKNLSRRHVGVQRVLSGTYMTSLNMPGFSITLLLLPSKGDSDAPPADFLLRLLDAPTSAPGWKWSSGKPPSRQSSQPASHESSASSVLGERATRLSAAEPSDFVDAIRRACQAVDQEEPEITRMDTVAGDGDCGLTLQAGARAVLEDIRSQKISGDDVVGCMIVLSSIAADKMGGTSGAIYSCVPRASVHTCYDIHSLL
ncbi:Dak1 domain-containing protein, partial [Amylostereum chailletii]